MVKIISVKVSKGGVGKTTIVSNLAYILARDKKVLIIDLDSQSNLKNSFKEHILSDKFTSSNLLGDGFFDKKKSISNINNNLDIIISDIGLAEVSKYLELNYKDYYFRLKKVIMTTDMKNYDYIIIDLSPGVADTLTDIALSTSDLVICPMHFDIDSISGIIHTIKDISRLSNAKIIDKELEYLIVPNRYDKRFEKDNKLIIDMVYENLEKEFIAEPIRENSHIKKARMEGLCAIEYENKPEKKYEHKKAIEDFEILSKKIKSILEKQ